tara:strand:+ start:16776 stop:18059 length:1284 start_codon:yes stop_codon:yes gene_type:complete
MQRVRLILPYLADAGAEATVLSVESDCVTSPKDVWLVAGLPHNIPIQRVKVLGLGWSWVPGLGTLTNRAKRRLRIAGNRLLDKNDFDLIYFSTTQFGIHSLGPYWKRKFGVPFAMDYQDPWVSEYYREHPDLNPPGGRIKYGIASWLNRRAEPKVLRECSGITSVSAAYPQQLRKRYDFLPDGFPKLVAPFPGDDADLRRVKNDSNIRQSIFDPYDGKCHWVYVGRGGADMQKAVRGLFEAICLEKDDKSSALSRQLINNNSKLILHFIGTSYASAGKGVPTIAPIAKEYGLENSVIEHTDRIPYSQTLRCLLDADALIVPGSDDAGYTASKLYPYLLSRRPMLGIFHHASSVCDVIDQCGGASLVTFSSKDSPPDIAKAISATWFQKQSYNTAQPFDQNAFDMFTARVQARQLADFFKTILSITDQ